MYAGMGSYKTLGFPYALRKEESRHLSAYQDIGLIYLQLSSAIRTNFVFLKPATEYFENSMSREDFQEDEIRGAALC